MPPHAQLVPEGCSFKLGARSGWSQRRSEAALAHQQQCRASMVGPGSAQRPLRAAPAVCRQLGACRSPAVAARVYSSAMIAICHCCASQGCTATAATDGQGAAAASAAHAHCLPLTLQRAECTTPTSSLCRRGPATSRSCPTALPRSPSLASSSAHSRCGRPHVFGAQNTAFAAAQRACVGDPTHCACRLRSPCS